MDYQAIDREMSSWLVGANYKGKRVYLTEDGLATGELSNAKRFRHFDQAEHAAILETLDPWRWDGIKWKPLMRAAAFA